MNAPGATAAAGAATLPALAEAAPCRSGSAPVPTPCCSAPLDAWGPARTAAAGKRADVLDVDHAWTARCVGVRERSAEAWARQATADVVILAERGEVVT